MGFDVVSGIDGSKELNTIVGTEKSLITIKTYHQLGPHIAKKLEHLGAINEIPAIMGVMGTHPDTNHGSWLTVHRFHI